MKLDFIKIIDKISTLLDLSAVNKKIDNKQFIDNAPKEIVEHEINKKSKYEKELMILQNNLNSLKL